MSDFGLMIGPVTGWVWRTGRPINPVVRTPTAFSMRRTGRAGNR